MRSSGREITTRSKANMYPFIKLIITLCALSLSYVTYSCTAVFANNKGAMMVVARTMDLFVSDEPQILVMPRGKMHVGEAGKNSLKWQAKYGSLVVTAFHTQTVSDGINEKGLAAHLLYLSGSEYPNASSSALKISNTLWAQYILDNFATVNDALEGTKNLAIVATKVKGRTWPIHLAIEDASGDSAIVEFLNGETKIYHGKQYRIMTNEPPYAIQLQNLKSYKFFGGNKPLPGDTDPLSRFVRVATYLKTLPTATTDAGAIAGIFSVIRTAMVPFGAEDTSGSNTEDSWPTRWVTVADLSNKLFFFNSTTAPNIIWFDLKKIDFSENTKAVAIDPTAIELEGDVTNQLK